MLCHSRSVNPGNRVGVKKYERFVYPHQRGEFDPSEFVNQALAEMARAEKSAILARAGKNAASLPSVLADRSLSDIERLQKFRLLTKRQVPGQEPHMLSVALDSQPDTWSYLFLQGKRIVYESGLLPIGHEKDFNAYRGEYLAQFFFARSCLQIQVNTRQRKQHC